MDGKSVETASVNQRANAITFSDLFSKEHINQC